MPPDEDFIGFAQIVGWPNPSRGPWFVAGHWALDEGRPVCVGLELWKGVRPEAHRVSTFQRVRKGRLEGFAATDLRELPVVRIVASLWSWQRKQLEAAAEHAARKLSIGDALGEPDRQFWEILARETDSSPFLVKPARNQRRASTDTEHFTKVAGVYRATTTAPTKAVAEHFHVSHSTATKWVARARALGLLGPTSPGKSGETASPPRRRRKP